MLQVAILIIHYASLYVISQSSSCLVPEEFKFHYRWFLIQNLLYNTAAKTDTFPNVENIFLCTFKVIREICVQLTSTSNEYKIFTWW
jgi:hypothetical protein